MIKKKYVLHPGEVRSRYDKQYHFISARKLASLYDISLEECEIYDYLTPSTWRGKDFSDMLHLYPLFMGNYKEYLEKIIKKREDVNILDF